MSKCPECGTQNPDGAEWCVECGTQLPRLQENQVAESFSQLEQAEESPVYQEENASEQSWWQQLRPDWKGALIFQAFWLILNAINTLTGGLGFVFSFPVYIATSLAQGVLVARYIRQDNRYNTSDNFKLGMLSGLWTALIVLAIKFIIVSTMVGISLGGAVALIPTVIVMYLASIVLVIFIPGLGAWLYGRYGGKKLAAILIAVGAGLSAIVCALIVALVAILATVGITLLPKILNF